MTASRTQLLFVKFIYYIISQFNNFINNNINKYFKEYLRTFYF